MTIQTFIEKAIEGGWNGLTTWNGNPYRSVFVIDGLAGTTLPNGHSDSKPLAEILLDPLAWQAVCEVGIPETHDECEERLKISMPHHIYLMHRMIDALAGGKTIEQYLKTL